MTTETSKEAALLQLADRAKNGWDYPLANAIFAILLDKYYASQLPREEDGGDWWLEWETQDIEGKCPGEVYYDLAVICCHGSDGIVSLCIPVPLLARDAAILVLKSARRVDRREHHRALGSENPDESKKLWEEFAAAASQDEAMDAVSHFLEKEAAATCAPLVEAHCPVS
jgi:hypothetical protein